jgi:hypothetical protein
MIKQDKGLIDNLIKHKIKYKINFVQMSLKF